MRALARKSISAALLEEADNGFVVARLDDTEPDELRELALDLRQQGAQAVVLIGSPDGSKVSLVAATPKGGALSAGDIVGPAAKIVGGGGGKGADLAVAGGRDATKINEALDHVRETLAASTSV